ncbi:MAG TPA: response regulator [Verrucomicrobiae bacterium]|nr:response regulator [Verrucomicrobiae bacterium]
MKTILLVEDDPVVVFAYRHRFIREGFHVETAGDGLSAMKILPSIRPDVVVLDLLMPKINGADVLKFIRSDPVLNTTPVIILSNAFMSDLATEAARAGAELALLKSGCTPALLVNAINQILSGRAVEIDTSKRLAVKG